MTESCRRLLLLLVALLAVAASPIATAQHLIHFFPSASAPTLQGFARIINHSTEAGNVQIVAYDETGWTSDTLTFSIGPGQVVHFNSDDLEYGNSDKGLSGGIGAGTGDWRLELSSELDLEVLAYIRTSDGFLTAMHDVAPMDDDGLAVTIFNPGSNANQVSRLRLINTGSDVAEVSITGVDDGGWSAEVPVRLSIAAGASRTFTSAELESGGYELEGALGDGTGKWRLSVESDEPLIVLSLLESPTQHLTNLSAVVAPAGDGVHRALMFPTVLDKARQGFARVRNRSSTSGVVNVLAYDDAGQRFGPLRLSVDGGETVHFNSDDLDTGNADKGLEGSIQPGDGPWRLELWSDLEIEVLSYIRTVDGFLTSMHDVVPSTIAGHRVAFFNPGSNRAQVSRLRLVNFGPRDAAIVIKGVDDKGESPGSWVRTTVPAGAARSFTAAELESGGDGLIGALGDGAGKWRLLVESDEDLVVMSLLESPTGHLTNLSTAPGRDSDWPAVAGSAEDLFGAYVSRPIVQSKCGSCHVAGGDADDTRLVFSSAMDPDHESINFARFEDFLREVEDGASLILDKVRGVGHEGGEQLAENTETYADLERFLTVLAESTPFEGPSVVALGPLAASDVTVTALGEPTAVVFQTTTDDSGKFVVPATAIADDRLLYLVEVSGGTDTDGNDDGMSDGPHENRGSLRAALTLEQIAAGANISVITDIAWRYANIVPSSLAFLENLERLAQIARVLIAEDLDGDGLINHLDLAAFDPTSSSHRQALAFRPESLGEPLGADGLSAFDAWLSGDEGSLATKLDAILGDRVSPFHQAGDQTDTVTVRLVPFGSGNVESSDGLLSHDPDDPTRNLSRSYRRSFADVIFFDAYPRADSEVLFWKGCDLVTPDLQTCEVSLREDRTIEVAFGYSEPEIVDNFADLSEATARLDANGVLSLEIPDGNDELVDRMEELSVGDYVVAQAGDGVLGRVDTIRRIDAQRYELTTSPASLSEVIKQGTARLDGLLTEGDLAGVAPRPAAPPVSNAGGPPNGGGERLRATEPAFSSDYPGVSLLLSGDPASTEFVVEFQAPPTSSSADVVVEGELERSVEFQDPAGNRARVTGRIALRINPGWVVNWSKVITGRPEAVRFAPTIESTEELSAEISSGWDSGEQAIRAGTMTFRARKVRVGAFSIELVPRVELYLGVRGSMQASVSTGVVVQQRVTAGFVYDAESGASGVFAHHHTFDFREPDAEIEGNAMVWVEPAASVLVYGAIGPRVRLRGYLRLRARLSTAETEWREQDLCTNYRPFGGWVGLAGLLDIDDRPSRGIWKLVGREVADFIKEEIGSTISEKVDAIVGFERGFFRREWPLPAPTLTVDRSGGQTFRDEMQAIRAFHRTPDGQIVIGGRLILGPQLGPEMVTIPAGKFLMGSREDGYPRPGSTGGPVRCDPSGCRGGTFTHPDSLPAHEVTIAQPFSISKHEIAKREMLMWANYCNASDSIRGPAYDEVSALVGTNCPFTSHTSNLSSNALDAPTSYPVELHPREIERYLSFLSLVTGARYRLPTESEWEYAARAGSTALYHWGDQPDRNQSNLDSHTCQYEEDAPPGPRTCNAHAYDWMAEADRRGYRWVRGIDLRQYYDDPFPAIAPVGSFPPNAWCVYDTVGNLPERTQDCWHDDYWGCESDEPDACKAHPEVVKLLGSSIWNLSNHCRAFQQWSRPDDCPDSVPAGFGDDLKNRTYIGCFLPEHCPEEPLAPTDGSAWGDEHGGNCEINPLRGGSYIGENDWGVVGRGTDTIGRTGFRIVRELD